MLIPEVREQLTCLADSLIFDEISKDEAALKIYGLVQELYRRPYVRKCRDKSKHATPELYRALRQLATANPDMTYQEIAVLAGVSAGRVSEAMAGKRK